MKLFTYIFAIQRNHLLGVLFVCCLGTSAQTHMPIGYLDSLKIELQTKWPKNRTIHLVFHGHSVPSGYLTRGVVNTIKAYPYLTLKKIKEQYPFAVMNAITTAIGGEQSEQGAERFANEVLIHKPDVLFIDYALNDRSIGLERTKTAWIKMIKEAQSYGTKVFLLTPTPDTTEDSTNPDTPLARHSAQIRALAKQFEVGLIDNYKLFLAIEKKEKLHTYMAQNNHINGKGHLIVADEIATVFQLDIK